MITANDPFAEPHQVVLCQHIQHGWFTIWALPIPDGYVRISDPVPVRFQKLNNTDAVQEALKAIDAMEIQARNELNHKLSGFADRRASLLALTHQMEVA